ncbi:VOC family protein [Planctomyces sp. SH-PL62]|uniref:VOC family protein n=1 Tax=Planctomyces sp. SH-PL62 TaxID=1636152 RepID=UPI00078C72C3|nr:VOC family protein [Planctomyces sp. SH-PL62]AMV36660.1 Glyoxalase-like domain protein [Planctomyces sp. SH-PL62]
MAIQFTEAFAAIGSGDFEASVTFYTAILGREPDVRTNDVHAEFHLPGGFHLAIFRPRADGADRFRNPPDRQGGLSLVFVVADVESAAVELARFGGPSPSPIMRGSHGREIYGYDPDGNRIILVDHAT